MNENDIVLTGSPRSGTTLAAYLLSKVENTVSLSEAIRPGRLGRFRDDPEAAAEGVESFYETARQRITDERIAPTKVVNGRQSFETYEAPDERGERREMVEFGEVPVEKPLGNDFRLSIKSPTLFTAILPALVKRFDCYAVVRNPLAVLASRNSLSSGRPPREYRPPTALLFDAEQARRMEEFEPRSLDWQLEMLRWACERYATYLPAENIIRYEDIVDTRGGHWLPYFQKRRSSPSTSKTRTSAMSITALSCVRRESACSALTVPGGASTHLRRWRRSCSVRCRICSGGR